MIIIFIFGSWNAEERLSGDKLKNKAAETPNVKRVINGSSQNKLGSSKAKGSDGFFWGL